MRGEVLELLDEVVAEIARAGDGLFGPLNEVSVDRDGLVVDVDDERLGCLDDRLDRLDVSYCTTSAYERRQGSSARHNTHSTVDAPGLLDEDQVLGCGLEGVFASACFTATDRP